ncbi:MAG TPA: hypothetical protein VHF22_05255, partial [Planctomycetota bacterium]|nr:hypothetical protein [Planctomycetota bacterium]
SAYFLRPGRKDVVAWLVLKLQTQSTLLAARAMLVQIEDHKAGSLGNFIADRYPKEYALRAGDWGQLPAPDKLRDAQIEFLLAQRQSGEPAAIAQAKFDLGQLKEGLADISTLRRDLANDYAAQAVKLDGDSSRRADYAALLRRAYALDPGCKTAKEKLGELFLRIGGELQSGAYLRSGPGDEYPLVRPLKDQELLDKEPASESDALHPSWRHVKGADGVEGYVSVSVISEGATKISVSRARRPIEDAHRYLLNAWSLAPQNGDIADAFARVVSDLAAQAGGTGDWRTAYERAREAASLAPGKYRAQVAQYYVFANPMILLGGLASIVALAAALLGGRRAAPPRAVPAPQSPVKGTPSLAGKKVAS